MRKRGHSSLARGWITHAVAATLMGVLAGCGASPPPKVTDKEVVIEVPKANDNGRLPTTFLPTGVRLELEVSPKEKGFRGEVAIDGNIAERTHAIVLHARDLTIEKSEVVIAERVIPTTRVISRPAHGSNGNDELVLIFKDALPKGAATLRLTYRGSVGDQLRGLYHVKDGELDYAFTQFEPSDARRAFPSFDEPGFKVPFELALRVPKGDLAVANMREKKHEEVGSFTRFEFEKSPPLPSYLVAFAVGPLEIKEGSHRVRVITTRGKSRLGARALEVTPKLVAKLEEYTGVEYPYPKLDLLAIPDFAAGAMENPGLITFREEVLLLDPQRSSARSKRDQMSIIAHELAHQWFGDYVTPRWWDDLWLNEGFATYFYSKAVDGAFPGSGATERGVVSAIHAMRTDELQAAAPVVRDVVGVKDAESAFDGITYDKGASVLRSLETFLEPDRFRTAVRSYLQKHAHGVVTTNDFLAEIDIAAPPGSSKSAVALLHETGIPLLRVTPPSCTTGQRLFKFERFDWSAYPKPTTARGGALPICVRVDGKRSCVDFEGGVSADVNSGSVVTGGGSCREYVFPNFDGQMYYRFEFSRPTVWAELAKSAGRLKQGERLTLLSSAWASFRSGSSARLTAEELLPLLRGFDRERDPLVLGELVRIYEEMSDLLPEVDRKTAFGNFAAARLGRLRSSLGWESRASEPDEQVRLRRSVISFFGRTLRDDRTLLEAEALAQKQIHHLTLPDPDAASLALSLSSLRASDTRIAELRVLRDGAKAPEERLDAVRASGMFGAEPVFSKSIDVVTSDPQFRLQDTRPLFGAALSNRVGQRALFDWVRSPKGHALLERLEGSPATEIVSPIATLCAESDIEIAKSWIASLEAEQALHFRQRINGGERVLAEAFERASRCVALRGTLGKELATALDRK